MPKPDIKDQIMTRGRNRVFDDDSDFDAPKQNNRIFELPLDMLVEYEDTNFLRSYGQPQPFREYTEEELDELTQNIKIVGVLAPVIVRPWEGIYQILAGRHRTRASIRAGKTTVPCRIIEADDDTAALIVVGTNLNQRHNLLYSEKAFAYKIQVEIMNRQGYRTDLATLCNDCTKSDSLSEAGKNNKDSRRTVAYYIRLTHLLPGLLKMVDSGKLPMMSGVNLSYLTEASQQAVLDWLNGGGLKLNVNQAEKISETAGENDLTLEDLRSLFSPSAPAMPAQTFSISRKKWKEYDALLPTDTAGFEELFRQFLDWLRVEKAS